MVNLKELSKIYKLQQKQLKKIGNIFRNIINKNLILAYHKLSVCKKPVKPQKASRSLSKTIKTE